ncbi:YppF family protein [Bacillus sp. AK128]
MNLKELRNLYIAVNKKEPVDNLELLQFAKRSYVRGDLTIIEYRDIIKELEQSDVREQVQPST